MHNVCLFRLIWLTICIVCSRSMMKAHLQRVAITRAMRWCSVWSSWYYTVQTCEIEKSLTVTLYKQAGQSQILMAVVTMNRTQQLWCAGWRDYMRWQEGKETYLNRQEISKESEHWLYFHEFSWSIFLNTHTLKRTISKIPYGLALQGHASVQLPLLLLQYIHHGVNNGRTQQLNTEMKTQQWEEF